MHLFLWMVFINSNCTCNRTFRYLLWQVLFILFRASRYRMKSDGGAFWNNVYITPWCRVAAFCVGLFLGVIFYKRPKANLSRVNPKSIKQILKETKKSVVTPCLNVSIERFNKLTAVAYCLNKFKLFSIFQILIFRPPLHFTKQIKLLQIQESLRSGLFAQRF